MKRVFYLLAFLLAATTVAAVPDSLTISFQARNSSNGNVLQLSSTEITLNIYDAAVGGSLLWNQTKTRSTDGDGFGYFYATGLICLLMCLTFIVLR
jgi:hypothetical protein